MGCVCPAPPLVNSACLKKSVVRWFVIFNKWNWNQKRKTGKTPAHKRIQINKCFLWAHRYACFSFLLPEEKTFNVLLGWYRTRKLRETATGATSASQIRIFFCSKKKHQVHSRKLRHSKKQKTRQFWKKQRKTKPPPPLFCHLNFKNSRFVGKTSICTVWQKMIKFKKAKHQQWTTQTKLIPFTKFFNRADVKQQCLWSHVLFFLELF